MMSEDDGLSTGLILARGNNPPRCCVAWQCPIMAALPIVKNVSNVAQAISTASIAKFVKKTTGAAEPPRNGVVQSFCEEQCPILGETTASIIGTHGFLSPEMAGQCGLGICHSFGSGHSLR